MASDQMQFRDNVRTSTSCLSLDIKSVESGNKKLTNAAYTKNMHGCRRLVSVRPIALFRCTKIIRTFVKTIAAHDLLKRFTDRNHLYISKSLRGILMRET